jgi:hypothetical protein
MGSLQEWSALTQPAPPARLISPSIQRCRQMEAANDHLVIDPWIAWGAQLPTPPPDQLYLLN